MSKAVKAARIVAPRRMEIQSEEVRDPREGEVAIRSLASGISAGSELNAYRGLAPYWNRRLDPKTRLFVPSSEPDWKYPFTWGYQCAGIVEEVGDEVGPLKPGDFVFAYAGHREYSVVPKAKCVKIPRPARADHAVFLSNVNTAYNGLLDARPVLGAVVVVMGLGIVGQLVTRLLTRTGPAMLVAVDNVGTRRDLARDAGATHVLDPATDEVAETVRDLTRGRGADIVIEVSGASAALGEAIRTVGLDGTVVAMSWYGGTFENLNLSGEFHFNRPRIKASQVANLNPELGPTWSMDRRMAYAVDALETLDLEALISHRVPLEKAPEMFDLLDNSPADAMQIILQYQVEEST